MSSKKHGKTIRIHLANGTPKGIRHAEIINWTGQACACPRNRISELSTWPESQRPGVYFLFGENSDGLPSVYIGESELIAARLQNHMRNKEFWSETVFFTSKDDNLTKAHVKYLEARLIQRARSADRRPLENTVAPSIPTLSRSDRDAMEEFLELTSTLLAALGFLVLQPLIQPTPPSTSPNAEQTSNLGPLAHIPLTFHVQKRNVNAKGFSTDEGFVVAKGSTAAKHPSESLPIGLQEIRNTLLQHNTLTETEHHLIFQRDVLFSSSSAAAALLAGRSASGPASWKTQNGTTLGTLEKKLTPEADKSS